MATPQNPESQLDPGTAGTVLSSISDAIEDIRAGKMVILVDDEDRENEGDLCMAAEAVTPESINFMATHGRGLICLAMEEAQMQKLHLSMMVPDHENTATYGTAFTVSIEAREGVTTGISAADRAHTVQTAIREDVRPADIARGTSSRCVLGRGVCCVGSARQRAPSIWPASRVSARRG